MLFALAAVSAMMLTLASASSNSSGRVGFGTAALGPEGYDVVTMALEEGFRCFDTAEAEWWYDQKQVGRALADFFAIDPNDDDEDNNQKCIDSTDDGAHVCGSDGSGGTRTCASQDLRISTKIPPWSLTNVDNIRSNAAHSRQELLGFCEEEVILSEDGSITGSRPFPLDIYYIHAPTCWKGWHPRCDNHPPLLALRSSWMAMEAVVGLDYSARRIGLSNVHPNDLVDIINFVRARQEAGQDNPPPRLPDAVQAFADPIEPSEELRQICQEHGIEFVSYSTLGTQHRNTPQNPVLTSPIVENLAIQHDRSIAEVVLSWALQKGMSVIPRSSKRHHIRELARLLQDDPLFLDDQGMEQIDSMKGTA
jgi:diketogulonate reductase-like aldo/keto reductase